jgi:hypothetical protein
MTSPDEAAAAEPQRVPLHALTHEHVDAVVTFRGTTGVLDQLPVPATVGDGLLAIAIQQVDVPYATVENARPDETVEIVRDAPPSPYDAEANLAAKTPEHLVWARELAQITDSIKVHEGEIAGLKKRADELGKLIMGYFELAGDRKLPFDGRTAYLKPRTFAQYKDRPASEGGGKYANADVVKVLRENRDKKKPVPEALAKLVELGEENKVAVGAPSRGNA